MQNKEIIRVKGDTNPIFVYLRQNSQPYDLTGATVTLTVNRNLPPKAGDVPLSITADPSTTNKAGFPVSQEIASLEAGDYHAEVKVVASDSTQWTPLQFRWRVKPSLT